MECKFWLLSAAWTAEATLDFAVPSWPSAKYTVTYHGCNKGVVKWQKQTFLHPFAAEFTENVMFLACSSVACSAVVLLD